MHVIGGSEYIDVVREDFGGTLWRTHSLDVGLRGLWGDLKEHLTQPQCPGVVLPQGLGVEYPHPGLIVVVRVLVLVGPVHLKQLKPLKKYLIYIHILQ